MCWSLEPLFCAGPVVFGRRGVTGFDEDVIAEGLRSLVVVLRLGGLGGDRLFVARSAILPISSRLPGAASRPLYSCLRRRKQQTSER